MDVGAGLGRSSGDEQADGRIKRARPLGPCWDAGCASRPNAAMLVESMLIASLLGVGRSVLLWDGTG